MNGYKYKQILNTKERERERVNLTFVCDMVKEIYKISREKLNFVKIEIFVVCVIVLKIVIVSVSFIVCVRETRIIIKEYHIF